MEQEESSRDAEQREFAGYWKYGRFYSSWKSGKYLMPIDAEELNRLDIMHKFFLVARGDAPSCLPASQDGSPRIIDLGTGTSIWAIHMAELWVPHAQIMTVDMNLIQPAEIPPSMATVQFDIEEPSWEPLMRDCDLIHLRLMLGSIQTDMWPQIYANVFEHLAPGKGIIEHVEVDMTPHWPDGAEQPPESAFKQWAEMYYEGMNRFGRNARVGTHGAKRLFEAAGFSDFKEEVIRVYVNPWSPDRHSRELARWFNLGFTHGIEGMSWMPLVEKMGQTEVQTKEICTRTQKETCILKYHVYVEVHVWTAKRPAAASQ